MIQLGFRVIRVGRWQFNLTACGFGFERYDSRGPWRQFAWGLRLGCIETRKWR